MFYGIVEGPNHPIYINALPLNVAVTLTFQGNANGPYVAGGGLVYVAPAGTTVNTGLKPVAAIFTNQTTVVTIDVPAKGGFVFYGNAGVGLSQYTTVQLESVLWGAAP